MHASKTTLQPYFIMSHLMMSPPSFPIFFPSKSQPFPIPPFFTLFDLKNHFFFFSFWCKGGRTKAQIRYIYIYIYHVKVHYFINMDELKTYKSEFSRKYILGKINPKSYTIIVTCACFHNYLLTSWRWTITYIMQANRHTWLDPTYVFVI